MIKLAYSFYEQVWKLVFGAWISALLLNLPQLYVFRVNFVTNTTGPFENMTVCESVFRTAPIQRKIFQTFNCTCFYWLPMIILLVCYVHIFVKIYRKTKKPVSSSSSSSSSSRRLLKRNKIQLTSTNSSTMSKAKIKTLKMAIVIVSTYIICGMPYTIFEMIYTFGTIDLPGVPAAILGGMAPANSALNPFIVLMFNANRQFFESVFLFWRTTTEKQSSSTQPATHDSTVVQTEMTTGNVIGETLQLVEKKQAKESPKPA